MSRLNVLALLSASVLSVLAVLELAESARGADWPMYRGDAARSGYTAEPTATRFVPAWTWYPRQAPFRAWPRDDRMGFDDAHQVAIANGKVFFGSSAEGTLTALDAATGKEAWTFFTEGPVRFAPAVWQDRVFAVSDDGYLYALSAADGKLIARWRGGPDETRVLGNERIISRWPARGGPVILDDIVYWAAGIWQSEGVFIYALRAATGEQLWVNRDAAVIDMPQPHPTASAASGVTAQGYLVASKDQLFVPTGRAVPAAFSRTDGKFQYYRLQENGQRGGVLAMSAGNLLFNGGCVYEAATGQLGATKLDGAVCNTPDAMIVGADNRLQALKFGMRETTDRKGKPAIEWGSETLWQLEKVPAGDAIIVAGNTLVSAAGARLATVDIAGRTVVWTAEVDAPIRGLAAANGRLYASTTGGAIHCFAPSSETPPVVHRPEVRDVPASPQITAAVGEILAKSGISDGYCVDLGCGDGELTVELARRSRLYVVAVDSDEQKVAIARRKLVDAGLHGSRATVHVADPNKTQLPRYFANLIVSARGLAEDAPIDANEVNRLQRPWGGVACLGKTGSMTASVRGQLDGAGQWTHLYATPANAMCSTDTIHGPLHVLWFRDMDLDLPQRHGRGPSPLVRDGRMFVEGRNALIAADAYNGRPLWRVELPGILDAYNADHLAGTAITGSNICLEGDSLFVRQGARCLRIEAATGKTLSTYEAPQSPSASAAVDQPVTWGFVACENGVLFGSLANRQHVVRHAYLRADAQMLQQFSESRTLFAMEAATGKLLWRYDAAQSIRHNAIAIGDGRVFLIDRALAEGDVLERSAEARRGEAPVKTEHAPGRIVALDARDGHLLWSTPQDVFGTMLIYSPAHQLLLSCYQSTRFKLPSEAGGRMAVYRTASGELAWDKKVEYSTRPLLNDRTIVAYPTSVDLLTGDTRPLEFVKSYGCGQIAASTNLLLFRSATFGYFDITRRKGTENFGGVRPGCWINALPVGGIVLCPDATAGCKCSYQNRAWMALEGTP